MTRENSGNELSFKLDVASRLARLALGCIEKEYPNKLDHVIHNSRDVSTPRRLHPAFYGCFDWHSAVHGHWMLVRLLKTFPLLSESQTIRRALDQNLSQENLAGELAYVEQPGKSSFERTYGWAWLLKLAEELHDWNDSDGQVWSKNLQPLTSAFATRFKQFLPKQAYPVRNGLHPNTAFGLSFAWDYAKIADDALRSLVRERSLKYFGRDRACPANWEPSGEDFLSPSLTEADLMQRVMGPEEFEQWFDRFLPGLAEASPQQLLSPVAVVDRSDSRIVHLDGLNLSRAWCMRSIWAALPAHNPARTVLYEAAHAHGEEGLKHVTSGDYAGEHWLASFAVYMLSVWEQTASSPD